MAEVLSLNEYEAQIAGIFSHAAGLDFSDGSNNERVAALSSELARLLLSRSHQLESTAERRARATLGQVVASHASQAFSVALTDRIHRSNSAQLTVEAFRELVERVDPAGSLSWLDRLQLWAGQTLGKWLPDVTQQALLARVNSEARPFLLPAQELELARGIAVRRDTMGAVNLNYLGEEVLGERDAHTRRATYRELARRGDTDALSIKLSGIDARLDLLCIEDSTARLIAHLSYILEESGKQSRPPLIYFDMEAYRDLQLAEHLVTQLLDPKGPHAAWSNRFQYGLAVQAYLPEALGLIERLAASSAQRVDAGLLPLRIRLVKGANLQTERVEASQRGLLSPVFPSKLETDAHYKRCLRRLMEHATDHWLEVGVASHNLFDISYALLLRAHFGVEGRVQLEMLEGMAGAMGRAVAKVAGSVLVYAPAVREEHFTSAVSYLVRRLDENTAPGHFLRDAAHMIGQDANFERQERAFLNSLEESWITPPRTLRTQDRHAPLVAGRFTRRGQFNNAPDTDWTRAANRTWLAEHTTSAPLLPQVRPVLHPHVAADHFLEDTGFDPSVPGYRYPVELAKHEHIEAAITAAHAEQVAFSATPLAQRVAFLRSVAERLEEKRGVLVAAMMLDAGKRAVEADIEVSEAVDFARYYAHIAETSVLPTSARGVTVVTPPWNFPLAIPLSGVLAALVAGNTVLFKPAPETPWVAQLAVDICHKAGVPKTALQFLPCRDEDAGQLIVDPRISTVVLTGATATAAHFLRARPTLHLLAETGGKNAAYVSALSDREQAIAHIVVSAFGHSGQKCSALSVLILEREVFEDEQFKRQLVDATETLVVASAWEKSAFVTPLIRPPGGALATVLSDGERHGTWALRPSVAPDNPRLLSPGILWGVMPGTFAQQTEFFGPVLSVMCAEDFEHGMRLLNASAYGLTAGLFSLRESEQERFAQLADAGNLYINRPITGAVVGRQPFGGRKHSGFGPGGKAGGADYLRQFVVAPPLPQISSGDDRAGWARISASYQRARRDHFAIVHQGTQVAGEHNYLRYQTARTVLVLCEDVDEVSLAASLLARQLTNNQQPIFVCKDPLAKRGSFELLEAKLVLAQRLAQLQLTAPVVAASVDEVLQFARANSIERLRCIGRTWASLLSGAAQFPLTVLTDPVSSDGHFELSHYLMSQSISHAYHRHGSPKLGDLSWLLSTLEADARKFAG